MSPPQLQHAQLSHEPDDWDRLEYRAASNLRLPVEPQRQLSFQDELRARIILLEHLSFFVTILQASPPDKICLTCFCGRLSPLLIIHLFNHLHFLVT